TCTMADTLDTAKVQAELCQFDNGSKLRDLYVYTITCYVIAAVFIGLWIVGRVTTRRLAFDDYIVVAAFVLTTIPLGLVLKMAGTGFGRHLWDL
ncbi:hypothetical protein BU23DRAFT_491438, partial [Bimuria novae-zelandiae CBS 107.79]